jgi:hypothetical protein
MDYKKGDLVIIDGYATYNVSYKDIRGIIIKSESWDGSGAAQVLIGGKVAFIPHNYIKKAEHKDAKGTHIQAR